MSEDKTLAQRLTEEYRRLYDKDVWFYNNVYIPEHMLDMEIQEIVAEYGQDKPGLEKAIDKALSNGWVLQLDKAQVEEGRDEAVRDLTLDTLQRLGANSETALDKLTEKNLESLTQSRYENYGALNDTDWAFTKGSESFNCEEFAERAYDFYRED